MKLNIEKIMVAVMVAGTLTLTVGCASQGYKKGAQTATQLDKTSDRIALLSTQIDSVLGNLTNLVEAPNPDLRPQYKALASSVSNMKSTAGHMASDRVAMGQKGKAYFATWDQKLTQISSPEIRAKSQARRDEVSKNFEAVRLRYTEVEAAAKPFMANLQDIQRYLSIDLTQGGLGAIKDQVAKTVEHSVPVKEALAKLSQEFRDLSGAMSSVTEAAAPAAPTDK